MTALDQYKCMDEKQAVEALLETLNYPQNMKASIRTEAEDLVQFVRKENKKASLLNKFIQEYDLSSAEGLALMTLAEALLRVPDDFTANALITDRLSTAEWNKHVGSADDIWIKISSLGLATSKTVVNSMVKRLGMPVIRETTFAAMKVLGNVFVLGQSMEEALKRGKKMTDQGYLYSYDMLGEGARTWEDADRYFESYMGALKVAGQQNKDESGNPLKASGVSVKLSAIHPKYHYAYKEKNDS
jgi:RHH-type proline utilization regulon transcriptional repressor/proline dehydrogenase/delta 1-pyrroline-5-carboxylate dehydrogenase